ncbi:MAG TPA: hypothetical protein IAA58_09775 [Candidatus Gallacutalibacter stercoravium]|nr:hypothetical protein [Candidatus Gallacutalibacter stercoravium]
MDCTDRHLNDPDDTGEVSYTFAMDMSKVEIPEKLTGLLYMLPGGDQEGRTAWDFLLQLAERISPLTTVTVAITIPDGFTVDTSDLRLANEYFTMKSAEIEGNKLIVTFNFPLQKAFFIFRANYTYTIIASRVRCTESP